MKQIKKFLGVFLALAMVIGTVGMMPVMEAKAAAPTIATPEAKAYTSIVVDFGEAINRTQTWFNDAKSDLSFEVYDSTDGKKNPNLTNIAYSIAADGKLTISFDTYTLSAGDYFKFTNGYGAISDSAVNNTLLAKDATVKSSGATAVVGGEEEEATPAGPAGTVEALSFSPFDNMLSIYITSDDPEFDSSGLAYIRIAEIKNGKTGAYSTYEMQLSDGYAYIDLSAYSKKGVTLSVYTDDVEKAREIVIAKNTDKLKINLKLDEKNAEDRFEVLVLNTAITNDQKSRLVYRVEGQEFWYSLYDIDKTGETPVITADRESLEYIISTIEQFGATINFKLVGEEKLKTGTSEVESYTFSSVEAKVKYPKLGKQPTVTVDYVKNVIKFAKGVEVKGILADAGTTTPTATTPATTWTVFAAAKDKAATVSIDDLLSAADVKSKFTFYARVAASGKKPNSAIVAVDVLAVQTTPDASKFEVTPVPKSATDSTITKINLTNKEASLIEYTTSTTDAASPDASAKWTTLAKDGTKALAKDVKTIFVRFPGVKATNTVDPKRASEWIKITVDTTVGSATVGNITVGAGDATAISAAEVEITLANDTFKETIAQDADLASWITNLPAGLTAKAKAVAAGDTSVTIVVAGTPTAGSTDALAITIPATALTKGKAITVTSNSSAKFNIVITTP